MNSLSDPPNFFAGKFKDDCRYFLPDRPCRYHKELGVVCQCELYQKVEKTILLIKLGAAGDVLRTTGLLQGLKAKYPQSHLTWLVAQGSEEVLKENPFIDRILVFDLAAMAELTMRRFDLLINLDVSRETAALASRIQAQEKRGFGLDLEGRIFPFHPEAEEWLWMSLSDDLKKANRKSYLHLMSEMIGINRQSLRLILNLNHEEREFARSFVRANGLRFGDIVIGLNTGAGPRWEFKKWTREGFLTLIRLLGEVPQFKILLLGGPEERERNAWLMERAPVAVIPSGWDRTLREFMALVDLCDCVVTGDTLALHVALALEKKVVALFGPTSSWEIDLMGQGEKIVAPVECICCYKERCDFKPNCMESISPMRVFQSIGRLLPSEHIHTYSHV